MRDTDLPEYKIKHWHNKLALLLLRIRFILRETWTKTGRPDVCDYKRDTTYYTQNEKVYVFFASAFKQLNSPDSTLALLPVKPHECRQMAF